MYGITKLDPSGGYQITGKGIELYRILVLIQGLKLETIGLRRRAPSVYSIVKKEFGFRGNKASVLKQLVEYKEKNYPIPTKDNPVIAIVNKSDISNG